MRGFRAYRSTIVLSLMLVLTGIAIGPAPAQAAAATFSEVTAILGYDDTLDEASLDALVRELGGEIVGQSKEVRFVVVATEDPAQFVADAQGLPGVRYAERDPLVVSESTPNDQFWVNQWGPRAINADDAWDVEKGDGAIVAVLDTGVDWKHSDLLASMWTNGDEVPFDRIDNDGNGYVDDFIGWNFESQTYDPSPAGCGDHGTHVAGIVAAQQDNVLGVSGVAPHTKIMALKMLCASNHLSAGALAVVYAANNGANIVTCSWYATFSSTAFEESVAWAYSQKNVLFVKSAGNQYGGAVTYPGTLPEFIAVSSLQSNLALSAFSSVGAKVELAAPGGNIYSTYGGTYSYLSGTSMAAPHVAGTAALLFAHEPGITNVEVRGVLNSTATDLGAAGRDNQFGFGIVDAQAALAGL